MAWILQWSYPSASDVRVTVFAQKDSAYKQACYEILNHIRDYLDLSKPDVRFDVTQINNLVKNGDYFGATNYWNNCSTNIDRDGVMYWFVYQQSALDFSSNPVPLSDIELGIPPPVEEKKEEGPFVPTTAGAICRCCHNPSEYAYADKPDGTYECCSCKMMKSVFT